MSEPWLEDPPGERLMRDAGWEDAEERFGDERATGYVPDGLVTLRYLWDAVRRHARLWLVTAAIGTLVGFAFPFVLPPPEVATTRLLVTHRPGDDPAQAIATDVSLATTETVAGRVVETLGLDEQPDELLDRYTVEPETDRIVAISVSADTGDEAARTATAIASAFLEFRMEQVRAQEEPTAKKLVDLQDQVSALERRMERNGVSVDDVPKPRVVREFERASKRLEQLTYTVQEQESTAALMSSSRTLDPASVDDRSTLKTLVVDTGTGLAAGLVLGGGFVVARALLSDRLWRRNAIADALGAPITVSVGPVPVHWWQSWRPWQRDDRHLRTAVDELRTHVRLTSTTKPALAVVPVDDVHATALVVAVLARSYAAEGRRVLLADLSSERLVAGRFGVDDPGVVDVDAGIAPLAVYVPEPGAGPPEGGLRRRSGVPRALLAAWDASDLVLAVAELDPALGADHLRTWAGNAVAVVSAGRSTATRIQATGEMVRLAGVRLDCAVLLRRDRTDETVGQPAPPGAGG